MSTKMRMLITMIIFITFFDIGISNPAGGKNEYAELSTRKNASIRLNLAKPKVNYGDHYLCRTKRIEERRYLTKIAPVESWGANYKTSLHACPRPTVEQHGGWNKIAWGTE